MHSTTTAAPARKIEAGARVTWTDPATGFVHADLLVEFAYPLQGSVYVTGCFGRASKDGLPAVTSRLVRLEHCVVQPSAEGL